MLAIDPQVISHQLTIKARAKPIKKKKKSIAPDRLPTLKEEVDKLLKVGFIREVHYLNWLTIVVMVKKPSGKWSGYVDFTNLNKTCLKDSYPLSRVNRLVDDTLGYHMLGFLDAFTRYH